MSEIRSQDSQNELFAEFSSAPKKSERFSSVPKTSQPILISTNIEQLLIAGILIVLFLCFIFFTGVLRGKVIASEPVKTQVIAKSIPINKQPERVFSPATPSPAIAAAFEPVLSNVADGRAAKLDLTKPYTIQLVTHKKKEFAEAEIASLRRAGYYSWVIPSGDYFQVCVGQYLNKEAARTDLKFFATKHKDCYLRRRPSAGS